MSVSQNNRTEEEHVAKRENNTFYLLLFSLVLVFIVVLDFTMIYSTSLYMHTAQIEEGDPNFTRKQLYIYYSG